MNNTIYTVDFFINKFSAIPEERWTTRKYISIIGSVEKRCAQGLCIQHGRFDDLPFKEVATNTVYEEWKSLIELFGGVATIYRFDNHIVAGINNGEDYRYQQPTPKQRIMAALYDLKKLEQPEPKVIVKYVSVSESLKKQTKELIEN